MKRERTQKTKVSKRSGEESAQKPATGQDSAQLKEDLDSILDDIDLVLEENAQEFIDGFVQRGGQ